MYTRCMHVSTSIRLATPTNGSPMQARCQHAPTCCSPCARECACVRSGAHASAPTRASAFCRRRPRVARLAGVLRGVGFQREYRRVEHRVSHRVDPGMRRLFGPASLPNLHIATCVYLYYRSSSSNGSPVGTWYLRAHVRGHECLYMRALARARVYLALGYICLSPCAYTWLYLDIWWYLFIAMDGSDINRWMDTFEMIRL
jgi:hypothetical protein